LRSKVAVSRLTAIAEFVVPRSIPTAVVMIGFPSDRLLVSRDQSLFTDSALLTLEIFTCLPPTQIRASSGSNSNSATQPQVRRRLKSEPAANSRSIEGKVDFHDGGKRCLSRNLPKAALVSDRDNLSTSHGKIQLFDDGEPSTSANRAGD